MVLSTLNATFTWLSSYCLEGDSLALELLSDSEELLELDLLWGLSGSTSCDELEDELLFGVLSGLDSCGDELEDDELELSDSCDELEDDDGSERPFCDEEPFRGLGSCDDELEDAEPKSLFACMSSLDTLPGYASSLKFMLLLSLEEFAMLLLLLLLASLLFTLLLLTLLALLSPRDLNVESAALSSTEEYEEEFAEEEFAEESVEEEFSEESEFSEGSELSSE